MTAQQISPTEYIRELQPMAEPAGVVVEGTLIGPRLIALIQASYEKLQPVAGHAGPLFFERLYSVEPAMRHMIGSPSEDQGTRFMQSMGLLITVLKHLHGLIPALEAMGNRYVVYGIKPQHYETLAACLLWTFEKELKDAFTAEMREAWVTAYVALSGTMKRGRVGRPV